MRGAWRTDEAGAPWKLCTYREASKLYKQGATIAIYAGRPEELIDIGTEPTNACGLSWESLVLEIAGGSISRSLALTFWWNAFTGPL